MERVILHSDFNNFYASVECLHRPEIRNKPVAVCGDAELRHGIVLAKNYIAKNFGIKTGDIIWQARQKCKDLVVVPANFPLYLRFSRLAHKIYEDYTDKIESFGIDECWLDVTENTKLFGSGENIANKIRERLKFELGITASIGVSWNKIFAKLASDMHKPDATTVINRANYKEKIFHLPASDLLYVGRATESKLKKLNINTIGEISSSDVNLLKERLGKWGEYLWIFANGFDLSPVSNIGDETLIKSVGNSTTTIRDLEKECDVRMIVTILAESVAARLRKHSLKGQVVSLLLTDNNLVSFRKQTTLKEPTSISGEIINTVMIMYRNSYNSKQPIRNVGVKVSNLQSAYKPCQIDMFNGERRIKLERLELAVDEIRRRFGHFKIRRCNELFDEKLTSLDIQKDHTIHPYSFFK